MISIITRCLGGRFSFPASAILLFAIAFLIPASVHAEDSVTFRLDYVTLGYHAPFYYGVEQGIYKKAGLSVNIEEGNGSTRTSQLVAAGNDDFGFADSTTVALLIGRGLPIKVVMGVLRGTTIGIYYAKDRGIQSAADLKGHAISSCPGDSLTRYIPAYLHSIDLAPSDVTQLSVSCSLKYTVIAQGKADAVLSYSAAAKPLLAKVGIDNFGVIRPGSSFYLPGHGIVASNSTIKNRPDLVRRFVAATQEAWLEAMKHPDAAIAAVIAANPLLKDQAASLKTSLLTSMQYINSPSTKNKPFGYQSRKDWGKALDILREYADLDKNLSLQRVFTNEFIPQSGD